jgi:hypothetical protein
VKDEVPVVVSEVPAEIPAEKQEEKEEVENDNLTGGLDDWFQQAETTSVASSTSTVLENIVQVVNK